MVQKAGDLPWIANPMIRKATVKYSVNNDLLTVWKTKDESTINIDMAKQTDTVTQIVLELQRLQWTQHAEGLEGYDKGLHNYLTRMLGVLWPWLRDRRWQQVAKTLQDYKEREELEFDHSEAGRLQLTQYRDSGMCDL